MIGASFINTRVHVVVAFGVVLAFVWQAGTEGRAIAIADSALSTDSGGFDQFCVTNGDDPAGVKCDDCLSNGNGGSVKCDNAGVPQIASAFIPNQNPPQRWVYTVTNCGGAARTYTSPNSNCTYPPNGSNTCYRTYLAAAPGTLPPGYQCGH